MGFILAASHGAACGGLLAQAVDAQQQLAESRAEWEVALQVLRQEKVAVKAQLRKALVSCCPFPQADAVSLGMLVLQHCKATLAATYAGLYAGQHSQLHTLKIAFAKAKVSCCRFLQAKKLLTFLHSACLHAGW